MGDLGTDTPAHLPKARPSGRGVLDSAGEIATPRGNVLRGIWEGAQRPGWNLHCRLLGRGVPVWSVWRARARTLTYGRAGPEKPSVKPCALHSPGSPHRMCHSCGPAPSRGGYCPRAAALAAPPHHALSHPLSILYFISTYPFLHIHSRPMYGCSPQPARPRASPE